MWQRMGRAGVLRGQGRGNSSMWAGLQVDGSSFSQVGGEASCQALLSTHDSGVEVRLEGSLGTVVPTRIWGSPLNSMDSQWTSWAANLALA